MPRLQITMSVEWAAPAGEEEIGLVPPSAGAGLVMLLREQLRRAEVELAAETGPSIHGWVRVGAGWEAELTVGGERHPDVAAREQGHHLLYRLAEFAATRLGGTLSESAALGFDDLRTVSPAAMLHYWAGLAAEAQPQRQLWMRALEIDPRFPAPRIGLARERLAAEDAVAAVSLLAGVAVADPEAAAELGVAIWAAAVPGGAERALELLQTAVAADAQNGLARAALAALLSRSGQRGESLEEALYLATQATQLAGADFRSWAALGDVHRARGDFEQAAFYYGFALRLQPDSPAVLKDAAAACLLARQPERALPWIERAIALTPTDAENYGNLAFVHDLMAAPVAAVEAARRAVEASPNDSRFHILLGDLANKAGEREQALDAWARAAELEPARTINPDGGNIGLPSTDNEGATL